MAASQKVLYVPEMSNDARIRVFRRDLGFIDGLAGMEVDAYIIITSRYVVVCDTLLCPEDAATMMDSVQDTLLDRIVLVVNSHADWDHAWGNACFTDLSTYPHPIIAHQNALLRLQSVEAQQELATLQQDYPLFRDVILIPPSITFDSQLTIHGGDLTLELIAAHGHTRDHIAIWIPELRLLLAFDAVETPLPCLADAASVPAMFTTLERFIALQPAQVLCSHGRTTTPDIVQANLSYFREIERRCCVFQQTHALNRTDLEHLDHPSELIVYSFDEVIKDGTEPFDQTYYAHTHEHNIRYMLEWIMNVKTRRRGGAW